MVEGMVIEGKDMDWSILASTALGGLLAGVGGFLGQWWAEGRANARESRERSHEQQLWAREQQRAAYAAFNTAHRHVHEQTLAALGKHDAKPIELDELLDALDTVEMFGTREALTRAQSAKRAMTLWAQSRSVLGEDYEAVGQAMRQYRQQARADLGLAPSTEHPDTHLVISQE